jgi:hypothetical protein
MKQEQKNLIRKAIVRYVGNYNTVTEAAQSMKGVSAIQIMQIINNNRNGINDRQWQHIAHQVGMYVADWKAADTSASLLLRILMGDAQRYAMNYGVSMAVGMGKTYAAELYGRSNDNVVCVTGSTTHNRKTFVTEMLLAAGGEANGTAPEMMRNLTELMLQKDEPLLIIDDAHLLKDRVLHMVVMLANNLMGKTGILLMGNEELRPRIIEGVRTGRLGYEEIYQTIGRRFVTLSYLAPTDVAAVCRANGVHDEETIAHISSNCDNCLHTATYMIQQCMEQRIAA